MHELAVCEAVLQEVLALAGSHGAYRIGRIGLTIGPLAGVEPALLLHAFPLVAAGTLCAAAVVEIRTAPVRVECSLCGVRSAARANRLLCADCGSWRVAVIGGDEMLLSSVELFGATPSRQGHEIHV